MSIIHFSSVVAAAAAGTGGSSPTVSASSTGIPRLAMGQTCYSTLRIGTDGDEYQNPNGWTQTATSSRGTWLTSGSSSDVWVEYSVSGDALDTYPPGGTGRKQLNTDRTYGYINTAVPGTKSGTITFTYWDQETGGSQLDQVNVSMSAQSTEGEP